MGQITAELDKKLLAAVEQMPAFPRSVQRILELTRDLACSPKELVQVIETDPVMTIKVLKVINSSYYSFPKKITSVSQCVVYLGFNTVKNLALGIAAIGILPKHNGADFDVEQYLLHSLSTASLAKLLCGRVGHAGLEPMDCYIAGLLHDFGKVVFAQFMPEEFSAALALSRQENIPLHLAEQRMIGADHTVVGSMLAEHWQFAQPLVQCIRHHHSTNVDTGVMHACLFLANQISKQMRYGDSGNACIETPSAEQLRYFGATSLEEVIPSESEMEKVLLEAKTFAQLENA
ncbi:HDOD domain-containing protein [Methylogaea oryzae]|nr:HDOD domain-containing protein [Methylogaea oryzae]